jgi:putative transposase
MKHLTRLKGRPHDAWLNKIPSQALQDIVQRIEKGYDLFFKSACGQIKIKVRPPSFKKSRRYKSFTLKQAGYKFLEDKKPGTGRIRIGRKVYKFVRDRELVGPVKTVTLKRDKLGNFYLCLAQDVETPEFKPTTGQRAGVDFGLKTFLTVHNGIETYPIQSPQFFKQALTEIRQANRALSRKQKGSNHRRQAKRHLAQVHQHIADRRQDWFFKLAHELTDRYDVLFFETLNLRGMKRLWGQKVSDLAFGTFLKILEHVAYKKGKLVHYIDRFYPSSKTCSHCGHHHQDLKLSEQWWRCPGCHKIVNRDGSAAVNIFTEGASSLGRADVIPYSVWLPVLTPETHGL